MTQHPLPNWSDDLPIDSDSMIKLQSLHGQVVQVARRTAAAIDTLAEDITIPKEGRRELINRKLAQSYDKLLDLETKYLPQVQATRSRLENDLLNGKGLDSQPLRMHEIRDELRKLPHGERMANVVAAINDGSDPELLQAVVSAPKVARLVPDQIHRRAARKVAPETARELENIDAGLQIAQATLGVARARLGSSKVVVNPVPKIG